jgi:hypothetical protein
MLASVTVTMSILLKINILVFFALIFYGGPCKFYHFSCLFMFIYLTDTFLVVKTSVPSTVNNNDVCDGITYLLHGAESFLGS